MATHKYSITFKSLLTGTTYTVNIGGGSGAAIALKGAAQPFSTQESDEEDVFTPVRTQSGYIRIVDDGKDASGNVLGSDWWKDLIPATATERPVTVTAGATTVWRGFIQMQNFSGSLYGNPQEREFPVQCALSVLQSMWVSTTETQLRNFAYLLKYALDATTLSFSASEIYVQGGSDAQEWLLKNFDWQNFVDISNDEEDEPRYRIFDVLEDMCMFWGWSCRVCGTNVYLTCVDDSAEPMFLKMTYAQLAATAGGQAVGTADTYDTVQLPADCFVSVNQDETVVVGVNKATVKADVNHNNTVMLFAPKPVRDLMDENNSYTWVQGDEDLTGYFTTSPINGFTTPVMDGTSAIGTSGFCRRQVYQTSETESAEYVDCMLIDDYSSVNARVSINTKKPRSYGGGSLKISGKVLRGCLDFDDTGNGKYAVEMSIGIGMTRATAKWFKLEAIYHEHSTPAFTFDSGWVDQKTTIKAGISGGMLNGPGVFPYIPFLTTAKIISFPYIPVDEGLYGYLYIDIYGAINYTSWFMFDQYHEQFEIGNFEIDFVRSTSDIPVSKNEVRERVMVEERKRSREYTARNHGKADNSWNADCIFASDNNMEYGFGLLMNDDGTFMGKVNYGNNEEYPEQHLADRVASFMSTGRRCLSLEVNTGMVNPTPKNKIILDSATYYAIAISHEWRDDVTLIKLIEL